MGACCLSLSSALSVKIKFSKLCARGQVRMRTRQILGIGVLLLVALAVVTEGKPSQSKEIPIRIEAKDIDYVKIPTNWCIRITQKNNTAKVKIVGILTKNACCNRHRGTQWGTKQCHGPRN